MKTFDVKFGDIERTIYAEDADDAAWEFGGIEGFKFRGLDGFCSEAMVRGVEASIYCGGIQFAYVEADEMQAGEYALEGIQ